MPQSKQSALALSAVFVLTCMLCSGSAALIAGPPFGLGVVITFGAIVLLVACSSAFTWLVLRGRNDREDES